MQLDWIQKTKEVVLEKFGKGYMELGTFYDIKFANGADNNIEQNYQKAKELRELFIEHKPMFEGTSDVLKLPTLKITADDDTLQIYDVFCLDKLSIDLDYVVEYDLRAQTQPIVDSGEKSQTSFTEETPMRIMFKEIFTFANHVQEIIIRNHSLKRLISDCEDTRKSVSPKALIDFFKLCDYKGLLSFNLDFRGLDEVEIEELEEYVGQVMECMRDDNFELMGDRDYEDFG